MAKGKGIASTALIVLACGLIVLAMVLTGGPVYARKETRDRDRTYAINAIWAHALCQAREGQELPEALAAMSPCGELPVMADALDQPYRYTRESPTAARICAAFELPETPRSFSNAVPVPDQPGCWDFVVSQTDMPDAPRHLDPAISSGN